MSIFESSHQDRLRGQFVYLEPVSEVHREILRKLAKDERIWEFTKTFQIDAGYDAQFDQYFNEALAEGFARPVGSAGSSGGQAFVICSVMDSSIIGMTRLANVEKKDKRLEIGWTWYSPAVWGKVHNKECKYLLLQYIFETLKFNRVEFRMVHQNVRSQKAVEKIGGVREGMLRKTGYRNDGAIKHTVIFSIIDEEWPEKKERLKTWIAGQAIIQEF